jgi:predicted transposase YbfD/YdcC
LLIEDHAVVLRPRWEEMTGMIEGLTACFAGLADPRETSRCDHQLVDILTIAVCAVIACAESWEDIELYGHSKRAWLETFLALPNGIPSHDTFRRVFMLIDPDAFEACFARWARSLAGGVEREVVAVDGKTLRRSGSRRREHGPLHLVSAWASERGLALGQRAVDGKSNEIAAIPELLDTLHLDGCIVTLDAMGCQKGIAERIRAKGADYLLVLKANHGRAFETVRDHFERTCFGRGSGGRPVSDAFEESHGRLVRRRIFLDSAARGLGALGGWPDLRAVLAVETIRSLTGTYKVEAEIRYFLTSCGDDPAVLVRAIRRHWSVENALHWVLDVTFREDDSRVQERTAARNLALLRKIALNLVARDRGSRASLRGRRKRAAWNDDYMLQLVTGQAHA